MDVIESTTHIVETPYAVSRPGFSRRTWLIGLALLSCVPYLYAPRLQDLRRYTVEFEIAFFAAFVLYLVAVALALRTPVSLRLVFVFAILFRALLIFTPPTLSDDMYRYVWDGRVQANGISPYAYAPAAPEINFLREESIWPRINRQDAVTVYPAGAELAFAILWRIVPDNVRWFQIAMAASDLLGGALLVFLLRVLGRPMRLALIYLWNPLVIFELAHSAHVDGLVLPLLIAAWIARVKGRDGWVGVFLGIATAFKFYPAVLVPALWRPRDDRGRRRAAWVMPVAFLAAFGLMYLPYISQSANVIGYLPNYFAERFNMGLAGLVTRIAEQMGDPNWAMPFINRSVAVTLAVVGIAFLFRPALNGEEAIRRCIWPIGTFTLLTPNLFPWYMLWSVPLVALFLKPGQFGFRFNAWTGWLLFSGLVALAYTFFIAWEPHLWVPWIEFAPLYLLLLSSRFVSKTA